jgi:hypothetical protein
MQMFFVKYEGIDNWWYVHFLVQLSNIQWYKLTIAQPLLDTCETIVYTFGTEPITMQRLGLPVPPPND